MAKHLGNFYTLKDLLDKGYNPRTVRYLLMSAHYRQQLNFTFDSLKAADKTVERLTIFNERLAETSGKPMGQELKTLMRNTKKTFEKALDDDLNITQALAALFDFVREVNRMIDQGKVNRKEAVEIHNLIITFDRVLGILPVKGTIMLNADLINEKQIENLIQKREVARKAKDWKSADEIRQRLFDMGVILEDTASGPKWRIKS